MKSVIVLALVAMLGTATAVSLDAQGAGAAGLRPDRVRIDVRDGRRAE